ncbi:MAG TPA: hypothetical protein VF167_17625 [Longimicrobiaceae bacterium]
MSRTLKYRQQVGDFRARIERILRTGPTSPGSRRIHIDTTGTRTRRVPFRTTEEHLALYGHARHYSVARILALLALVREVEKTHLRPHRVSVQPTGAIWQAYKGTAEYNACHTCPSFLLFDGQLPSQITTNRALQRHLVVEFSDCMLMPRSVNEVDIFLDEAAGRAGFATAAEQVLNDRSIDWQEGVEIFREEVRSVLGPIGELYHLPPGRDLQLRDPEAQQFLDALTAYFEGLFLRRVGENEMRNFIGQVLAEMGSGQ